MDYGSLLVDSGLGLPGGGYMFLRLHRFLVTKLAGGFQLAVGLALCALAMAALVAISVTGNIS